MKDLEEKQYKDVKQLIKAGEKIEKSSIIIDLLYPKVAYKISEEGYNVKSLIRRIRNKSYSEIYLNKSDSIGKISIVEE